MKRFIFDDCNTVLEAIDKYKGYGDDLSNDERAVLDWSLYVHIADNLSTDMYDEYIEAWRRH